MSVLLIATVAGCAWVATIVGVLAVCKMAARGDAGEQRARAAAEQHVPKITIDVWEPMPEPGRIAASRERQPQRHAATVR